MRTMKRGGAGSCFRFFLVSVFFLFLNHHSHCDAQDDYAMLLQNQGYTNDATDTKSKLVSSLKSLLEQEEQSKRASSFFPLRGKKTLSSDSNNPDNYQLVSSEEDKRSQFFPLRGKKIPSELKRASYFMPMRGRKDDDWELPANQEEEEENADKRASSFMPMRGKKKMGGTLNAFQHFGKSGTYSNTSNEIALPSSSGSRSVQVSDKRMSFIPVRGRKAGSRNSNADTKSSDIIEDNTNETHPKSLRNKRSSSFVPMRGRRLLSDSLEEFQSYENGPPEETFENVLEKRRQSFMPMRGRRTSHDEESSIYSLNSPYNTDFDSSIGESNEMSNLQEDSEQNFLNDISSRNKKPSSFMPMRGKKEYQSHLLKDMLPKSSDEIDYKMIPINTHDDYFDSYSLAANAEEGSSIPRDAERSKDAQQFVSEQEKRASSFMPMRGRRDDMDDFSNADIVNADERITHNLLSTPVQDHSHDKRAYSFLPMRGRRDNMEDLPNTDVVNADERITNIIFSTSVKDHNHEKKAHSFLPMRGRRSLLANESFEDYLDGKRGYSFMPMRGRRWGEANEPQSTFFNSYPYFIPTGIGSALISRPFGNRDKYITNTREAAAKLRRIYDWDSVKRAFHATRGKRLEDGSTSKHLAEMQDEDESSSKEDFSKHNRFKRNIFHTNKNYLALKRPMSFFATRGKRMDPSAISDEIKTQ